jgi:hypothetical protein
MHRRDNGQEYPDHLFCNYRKLPVIVSSKNPGFARMNDDSFIKSEAILINIIFLLDYSSTVLINE